ncbi:MAG: hypothetical protein IJ685_02975 [Selenomonadaceae bacterium]|nr:hypothetical protein [Selenomonadaceae bacterium]
MFGLQITVGSVVFYPVALRLTIQVPKRKVAKENGTPAESLVVRKTNVAIIRARCCPQISHHAKYAGRAVIHDGSDNLIRLDG